MIRKCIFSGFFGMALLMACHDPSEIQSNFYPGISLNYQNSLISTSASTVSVGQSITLTVSLKDNNANPFVVDSSVVSFTLTGGTSTGTLSAVTNHQDGSYSVSYTGVSTGTPNAVHATVNGVDVTSTAPTVRVISGAPLTGNIWNFNSANASSFSLSGSLDFTTNYCELTPAAQLDNSSTSLNSTTGFTGGTSTGAAFYDSANAYLRLGTSSSNLELDSSWTPAWSKLVGYWKFNTDFSATLGSSMSTGGAIATPSPAMLGGGAAYLDGSSYASTAAANTYSFPDTTFTVMGWVKSTSSNVPIVANGYISSGWAVYITAAGKLNPTYKDSGSQSSGRTGGITVNDGNWHHWAAVFTTSTTVQAGNSVLMYVDGVPDNSASMSYSAIGTYADPSNAFGFAIGARRAPSSPTNFLTGYEDEVAIWSTGLSASAIQNIYQHQLSKHAGTFTSRVMDGLSLNQPWTSLSFSTTLPFFKELPDSPVPPPATPTPTPISESSVDYSAQSSNLMNNILALWHFDETSWNQTTGELKDRSGNGNNGTSTAGVTLGTGVMGNAAVFSGTVSGLPVANPSGMTGLTSLTVSVWVKTTQSPVTNAYPHLIQSGGNIFGMYTSHNGFNQPGFFVNVGGSSYTALSGSGVNDNRWHHMVGVWNGANVLLYIDGIQVGSLGAANGTLNISSTIYLGTLNSGSQNVFVGSLDEVGMWGRAFSSAEVIELYRRAANRIKYQVRTCVDSTCSANPAWQGPSATDQTYFTEINNNAIPASGGDLSLSNSVNAPSATMTFTDFTAPTPSANRFFQYRAVLESDDTSTTLCTYDGGSTHTWCSPELKAVSAGPNHYDTSAPTVITHSGITYLSLTAAIETLGSVTHGCDSGVLYNLGVGSSYSSAIWYYWDTGTSHWLISNGTSNQATSVATLNASANAALTAFGTQVTGTGVVYLKAYLQSTGSSACQLKTFEFDGLN